MLHVIYDDQCGFCIRSLKVCRAFDVGRRLQFHGSSQLRFDAGGPGAFPELAQADVENAMFAVAPDRHVTRGFFAVRRIAREVPLLWPLLALLYFPGSARFGPRLYAWVARNRHRFGCESEVCAVRAPGQPPL
jgi:predicted DCC family thiol-disulfide oxidoreductase YuxK